MSSDAIVGCILGTAVGDALGLPCEGLSSRRLHRVFRDLAHHHFILGHGMVSDDSEHTFFVGRALLEALGDANAFEKRLARALRWWLAGLPAGAGLATLKACIRLWVGVPPSRSGVFSAGNGPAMRSALLGVACGGDMAATAEFVLRSTRITHTDPRAYCGALVVAIAAHLSSRRLGVRPEEFAACVRDHVRVDGAEEMLGLIDQAAESATRCQLLATFAATIGCRNGISGYILHTVPCVIQTWLRHQDDYRSGILEIIAAGGDTDTTAAILGGIVGARVGEAGIPHEWLAGIVEWPRSVAWMRRLGVALSHTLTGDNIQRPPPLFFPGLLFRNAVFTIIVLAHGIRRLAPPY